MPRATATHWVTRNPATGQLEHIAVRDMSTAHLLRTVRVLRSYLEPTFREIENADERVLAMDAHLRQFRATYPAILRELQGRGYDLIGNPFLDITAALDGLLAQQAEVSRRDRGGEVAIGMRGNRTTVEEVHVGPDVTRAMARDEYGIREALRQIGLNPDEPVRRRRRRSTRVELETEHVAQVEARREAVRLKAPTYPNRRKIRVD